MIMRIARSSKAHIKLNPGIINLTHGLKNVYVFPVSTEIRVCLLDAHQIKQ